MQTVNQTVNQTVDTYLSSVKNDYVSAIIVMFVVLYSSLIPSVTPFALYRLMNNYVVKFIAMFLFLYVTGRNASVAIVVSLLFVVAMMLLSKYAMTENMSGSMGTCPCGCTDPSCRCSTTGCTCVRGGSPCDCGCKKDMLKENFCTETACIRDIPGKEMTGYYDTPTIGEIPAAVQYRLSDQINDDGASMKPLIEKELSHEAERPIGVEVAERHMVEEDRVNMVLSKVTELKQKLGRDLTPQELKAVCEDALTGDFSDEALQMLRSEVDYRRQKHGKVKGYDEFPLYATVGMQ